MLCTRQTVSHQAALLRAACSTRGYAMLRQPTLLGGRSSLKDLVRTQQQRLWNRQAQRFRRLEVDHKLELGRLLDSKLGGLRTLEDLVDESGGTMIQVRIARPVGDQPSVLGILPGAVNRRQPVLGGKLSDRS